MSFFSRKLELYTLYLDHAKESPDRFKEDCAEIKCCTCIIYDQAEFTTGADVRGQGVRESPGLETDQQGAQPELAQRYLLLYARCNLFPLFIIYRTIPVSTRVMPSIMITTRRP